MKFTIKNLRENPLNLARKIGYYFLKEEKDELSFIRPLERSGYPRFHLYVKINKDELIFNLHLDQKRPIYPVRKFSTSNGVYKGAPAHSGEYEGLVIEKEVQRIKQILK